jgi:hypothetical protein
LLGAWEPELPPGGRARILQEAAGNPLALLELPAAARERDDEQRLWGGLPLTERLERASPIASPTCLSRRGSSSSWPRSTTTNPSTRSCRRAVCSPERQAREELEDDRDREPTRLCAFQSSSEVAEPGHENSDGADGAEHSRDLQRTPTKAAAIEAARRRQGLDEFDGRRHIAPGSVGVGAGVPA